MNMTSPASCSHWPLLTRTELCLGLVPDPQLFWHATIGSVCFMFRKSINLRSQYINICCCNIATVFLQHLFTSNNHSIHCRMFFGGFLKLISEVVVTNVEVVKQCIHVILHHPCHTHAPLEVGSIMRYFEIA